MKDQEVKKNEEMVAVVKGATKNGEVMPNVVHLQLLARDLLASEMFPNVKNIAGAVTIIEYGRELGIPPVAALNTFTVINGKLCMEAKAMLAIAAKHGVTWSVDKLTTNGCTMTFSRPNFKNITVTFDEADAKAAKLLPAHEKSAWSKFPKDMYFARCASRGVRQIASDKLLGLYSIEEMKGAEPFQDKPIAQKPKTIEHEPIIEEPSEAEVEQTFEQEAEKTLFPQEPETNELDQVIEDIKAKLKEEKINNAKFKSWLYLKQTNWERKYVGKIGTSLRYHLGDPNDVKSLLEDIEIAIIEYKKYLQAVSETPSGDEDDS